MATSPPVQFKHPTPRDDELIGRCVRMYSLLEHSLSGLLIDFHKVSRPMDNGNPALADKKLSKKLRRTATERVTELRRGLHELLPSQVELLQHFDAPCENIEVLFQVRNHICHGLWHRISEQELHCYFWSRTAMDKQCNLPPQKTRPELHVYEAGELEKLADEVIRHHLTAEHFRDNIRRCFPEHFLDAEWMTEGR